MCVHASARTCVYVFVCMHAYMCACACVHACVCVCVCIFSSVCIHSGTPPPPVDHLALKYAESVQLKSQGVLEVYSTPSAPMTNTGEYGIIWRVTNTTSNEEYYIPQVCVLHCSGLCGDGGLCCSCTPFRHGTFARRPGGRSLSGLRKCLLPMYSTLFKWGTTNLYLGATEIGLN